MDRLMIYSSFCYLLCDCIVATLLAVGVPTDDLGVQLQSQDVSIRRKASAAIRELGDKHTIPLAALTSALKDADRTVRENLISTFKQMKGRAAPAVPYLIIAAKREQWNYLCCAINETITEIGPAATPHLLREIGGLDNSFRAESLAILEQIVLQISTGERKQTFAELIPIISSMIRVKEPSIDLARILARVDPEHRRAVEVLTEYLKTLKKLEIADLRTAEVLARTRSRFLVIVQSVGSSEGAGR